MTDEVIASATVQYDPLGEIFISARNAKNLTQKDVSNNLRLSIKQINALENNDFANLPQAMITRGFIRNYARMLELDAEPLLESYRARVPEATPNILTVQTSTRQVMLRESSTPWFKYIAAVVLILLPILAWFLYTDFFSKQANKAAENVDATSIENATSTPMPLPEIALPAAERLAESITPLSTNEAPSAGAVAVIPDTAQATKNQANQNLDAAQALAAVVSPVVKDAAVDFKTLKEKAVNTAQMQAAPPVVPAATSAVNSGLKTDKAIAAIKSVNMSVSEETWVRVTDKSGAVVFEKVLAANSTDGFDGLPPFKLHIGNAKATSLTFLGQPVDLSRATKNNVARITLE
ncbi:MAG: helix-turn-helix domain-containing protein [Methylotenera sp.]|nr:helix-turn-helix domain-containing protein [Methylotenera sp.]